jgi:hypothetical protein
MSLERALKRPLNYHKLSSSEQWSIDKELGILDWEPTLDEAKAYKDARACVVCGDPRTGQRTCGDRNCTGIEYGDG